MTAEEGIGAYIARCRLCRGIAAAQVDDRGLSLDALSDRGKLTVHYVDISEVRIPTNWCRCRKEALDAIEEHLRESVDGGQRG